MDQRRSIRYFSDEDVPKEVIDKIILTAGTAPSGAHQQPWMFCAISSSLMKAKIREAAEEEEKKNYNGRMSEQWLEDLKELETNWEKPFLEKAPWLIVVFKQVYGAEKKQHYYVNESVGIASGMLISAIHNAGLVTLTHTPSPMKFLEKLLERPKNERAFLLLPVGHPAAAVKVPDLKRKSLEEIALYY
jgi:nitroreductase